MIVDQDRLADLRERRVEARTRARHYSQYTSLCARADMLAACDEVNRLTEELAKLDPMERRASQ